MSFDPRLHPVMPPARIISMSRSSVPRLPRARMADITAERFRLEKTSAIRPSCRGAETVKLLRQQAQNVVTAHSIKIPCEVKLVEQGSKPAGSTLDA